MADTPRRRRRLRAGRRRRLRIASTSYLARERELAELTPLLPASTMRLLTPTVTGRVGKSRLARALARALADGHALALRIVELEAALDLALAELVMPALPIPPAGPGGEAVLLLPGGLTPREIEVLAHLAQGKSNRQIGEGLTLSVRTVERHIENLYHKIGAHSRFEAAAYGMRYHPSR